MYDKHLDIFLSSVCNGSNHPNLIKGYSLEREFYLSSRGYIKVEGEGVYKTVTATQEGQQCFRNGGIKVYENSNNLSIMKKVFIVHGHDNNTLNEVKEFVKSLNLEPIILREQVNRGQTLIQKFETYSNDVLFAIILYTPCDMGRKKRARKLKPRARQNVVLEHGYFIGKLGSERVLILYKKGVEMPSDMLGVAYIEMDSNGKWKNDLNREIVNFDQSSLDSDKMVPISKEEIDEICK